MAKPTNQRGDLTQQEKSTILIALLEACRNGQLPHGVFTNLEKEMGFSRRSISRIWKQYQSFLAHTSGSTDNAFLSNQKKAVAFLKATQNHKTNSGRKKIYCPQSFKQEIKNMKLDKRQNQRDIAQTMKVTTATSKTTGTK